MAWMPVVGLESYYHISSDGELKQLAYTKKIGKSHFNVEEHIVKPRSDGYGYLYWRPRKSLKYRLKVVKIHRLVAQAFIPNPENKPQVNHKNGIKTDNRVSNLEWATAKENIIHSYNTGLANRSGENNGRSKLSENDISEIREMREQGMKMAEIASKFNISQSHVSSICSRKYWGCV